MFLIFNEIFIYLYRIHVKLRNSKIYYKDMRIIPSYIMTGGNLLIEKSKVNMITEDITTMLNIIN